jgi:hypothetical protein
MHWKPQLPDIFLGISLGAIAIEAALSRVAIVRARYRASDTFASLGMQVGNIAMNLMMAGIVFAGLSAAYEIFAVGTAIRQLPGMDVKTQTLAAQAIIRDRDTWLSGSGGFDVTSIRAGG